MAQLIKLRDYISRYERNIYRYPVQYMRMKQENWKKLYQLWETEINEGAKASETKEFTSSKWKGDFKHKEPKPKDDVVYPATLRELKQYFLDQLFPFQLKWASSTMMNVSFIDHDSENDQTLQYFLQRVPDTFFVMYYPIFKVQNASIEGEIIFISPLGIEIIYLLEKGNGTIYPVDNRTWMYAAGEEQSKFISPLIALKRTEKIIKGILKKQGIDFPVSKTVLSRTDRIDPSAQSYHFQMIDKSSYEQWLQAKRNFTLPLKNGQLKTAAVLLEYCQTTSVKRPEWMDDICS